MRGFVAAVTALALAVGPVLADEAAGKIRDVSAKHKGSLAVLRGVVEIQISLNGQTQNQEAPVEFPACALGSGLFVAVNPENAATYQNPQMARMQGLQIEVRGKEYKLVYGDGTETGAKIEGVDSEYGLAFLRAEGDGKRPSLSAGAGAKKLAVGDPFVALRLVSSGRSEVSAEFLRVDALLEKPSPMCRFSSPNMPAGVPAFDLDGDFVGLTCVYQENRGGGQGPGAAHQVLLPASRLSELLAQVTGAATPQK